MKYSIIIPVYNAENYLDKCVGGILAQKADCEIILVDDGSSDSSPEICDNFSKNNRNVKVIHTPNGGAGRARNIGVGAAEGDYIIFADADDMLSDDFFEKLGKYNDFNCADVVFFQSIKVFPDGSQVPMNDGLRKEKITKKSRSEVLSHIAECSKFPASCWGKIIDRSFYIKSGIKMSEKLLGEDIDWTLELMEKAEKFDFFPDGIYYYRKNPSTRSSHNNPANVSDQLSIIEKWKERTVDDEYKKHLKSFLAYQYAMIFPFYGALDRDKRSLYYSRMKENRELLKYGKTKKLRLIDFAVRFLGINTAATVLYKYVLCRDKEYIR